MRRLAGGVAVISAVHEGQPLAMTATAVSSLSLEPPALLVCINRGAGIFAALAEGARFCVNLLGRDQAELARVCGRPGDRDARFSSEGWAYDDAGLPYLTDAQAAIFCKPDGALLYGSHGAFVGKVEAVRIFGKVDPLIYADGRYGGFEGSQA